MDLAGKTLTTEMFWWSTLVVALIDFGFVFLLARRVTPARFRELRWPLFVGMLIVWVPIWMVLFPSFWDSVYRLVMPPWARWAYQFFGVIFPAIGLAFWWLALRIPGHALVNFALLGGLLGFATHLWAMYGACMHEKVPLLRGVSPISMIIFAFFEYMFYWCVALLLALLINSAVRRGRAKAGVS